ncbi:hypothetical protein Tco_0270446 [Tanacetum coccineum]
MANMDFCDKHNMVAFLKKPTGSEEFHKIVDFLAGSHIRYALTVNPTIYVSFIEQFWQTATVKIVNDGEQQITVIVDGQTIAITEASVRRHLQLVDADEQPSQVPTTEPIITTSSPPLYEITIPHTTPSMPHDSPLSGGDTPGSDEGSKKLNELTELLKKAKHLESKLKSTLVRRKSRMVISDDEEDLVSEDPSKQGRMTETEYEDQITPTKVSQGEEKSQEGSEVQLDVLSAAKILADASRERVKTYKSYTRRRRSIISSRDSTAGGLFSTAKEILSTDERIAKAK